MSPDYLLDEANEVTLLAPEKIISAESRQNRDADLHPLTQTTREETAELVSFILSTCFPKHQAPTLIGRGGERMVFACGDMTIKVALNPQLTSQHDQVRAKRHNEFQRMLRAYFPQEWLLPEHPHDLIVSETGGKTWMLFADFQKKIASIYPGHKDAPSWCYRCPERGDDQCLTQENQNRSLTVQDIVPEPGAPMPPMPRTERERNLHVARQLLWRSPDGRFDEEEFLLVHRSPQVREMFRRVETDTLFKEKLTAFIDAVTMFSEETKEIIDGMGSGNILFREDMAWDPLLVDARPPDPPRILSWARVFADNYMVLAEHPDRWKHLGNPLVILTHAFNNVRMINACRRKLKMDPAQDIALLEGDMEHLGLIFDDMRAAFRPR